MDCTRGSGWGWYLCAGMYDRFGGGASGQVSSGGVVKRAGSAG